MSVVCDSFFVFFSRCSVVNRFLGYSSTKITTEINRIGFAVKFQSFMDRRVLLRLSRDAVTPTLRRIIIGILPPL